MGISPGGEGGGLRWVEVGCGGLERWFWVVFFDGWWWTTGGVRVCECVSVCV